jgi:glucokinase
VDAVGAQPHLLRMLNQSAVLEVVRKSGQTSRADVARVTGLSRPTVSQAVSSLLAADLIREIGAGESTVGRKPVLLTFNPDAAFVVGVDLGATKMLLGIANLDGKILVEQQVPTPVHGGQDGITAALFSGIARLIQQPGVGPARVCGIGIGVSGAVDTVSGVVIEGSGLGVRRWPLRSLLEERFGLPVFVDNDVNALLRGEQWKGSVGGRQNALCFSIGTGLGGAMLINGQIHRGSHHVAGEVGASLFDRSQLSVNHLNGYGPLERAISGPGLVRYVTMRLEEGADSSLRPQLAGEVPLSPREIFAAARLGDGLALEAADWLAEHLALLVGNGCLLVDPEVVVLTGSVSAGADLFLPRLMAALRNFVVFLPEVAVSTLGARAGVLGAVAGVLSLGRSSISFHAGESVIMMGAR